MLEEEYCASVVDTVIYPGWHSVATATYVYTWKLNCFRPEFGVPAGFIAFSIIPQVYLLAWDKCSLKSRPGVLQNFAIVHAKVPRLSRSADDLLFHYSIIYATASALEVSRRTPTWHEWPHPVMYHHRDRQADLERGVLKTGRQRVDASSGIVQSAYS